MQIIPEDSVLVEDGRKENTRRVIDESPLFFEHCPPAYTSSPSFNSSSAPRHPLSDPSVRSAKRPVSPSQRDASHSNVRNIRSISSRSSLTSSSHRCALALDFKHSTRTPTPDVHVTTSIKYHTTHIYAPSFISLDKVPSSTSKPPEYQSQEMWRRLSPEVSCARLRCLRRCGVLDRALHLVLLLRPLRRLCIPAQPLSCSLYLSPLTLSHSALSQSSDILLLELSETLALIVANQ